MAKNLFIFCHQAKTGGSTLVSIFKNCIETNRFLPNISSQKLKELIATKELDTSKPIFIHGHYSPSKYKFSFPDAIYLTIFREPTQYINSLYYFWKRTEIRSGSKLNPLRAKLLRNNLTLIEFVYAYAEYSNISFEAYDPQLFEWVGITEHYNESLKILKNKFNFIETERYSVKRRNPIKSLKDKYSDELQPIVKKLLKTEYEIYEAAVNKFNSDLKKYVK